MVLPIIITNASKLIPLNTLLKCVNSVNFDKFLGFLKIADNKDKLLKILQYIVKLILVTRGPVDDFKAFASTLSLARKLGRLGNWLPGLQDLRDLLTQPPSKFATADFALNLIATGASVGNDLLDDWICLQKGRLLSKKPYIDTLDLWSTRLWFLSVSIELHFTLKKLVLLNSEHAKSDKSTEEYKMQLKKRTDVLLTASKQLCDWTFCIWELANLAAFNEHVPVIAGLSAATIGAIRGWRKLK